MDDAKKAASARAAGAGMGVCKQLARWSGDQPGCHNDKSEASHGTERSRGG